MHVIMFKAYFYHFVLFHVMILKYTNLWIILHYKKLQSLILIII